MRILEIVNRLLGIQVWRPELVAQAAEPAIEIRIDVRDVTSILKGRRLQKSRRKFRGFDSPPGRF